MGYKLCARVGVPGCAAAFRCCGMSRSGDATPIMYTIGSPR